MVQRDICMQGCLCRALGLPKLAAVIKKRLINRAGYMAIALFLADSPAHAAGSVSMPVALSLGGGLAAAIAGLAYLYKMLRDSQGEAARSAAAAARLLDAAPAGLVRWTEGGASFSARAVEFLELARNPGRVDAEKADGILRGAFLEAEQGRLTTALRALHAAVREAGVPIREIRYARMEESRHGEQSDAEVDAFRDFVGAETDDCVVIVADLCDRAADALNEVSARAEQALVGIPEETRKMLPDGSSAYLRPLPGAARMYPETDVPPVPISGRIEGIAIPELLSDKKDRYVREYDLSEDLARKMVYSRYLDVFDTVMGSVSVDAALVVRTLTATLTELRKDGVRIGEFSDRHFLELFSLVADNTIAKEGIIEILRVLADQPDRMVADVAESIGIVSMDEKEIADTIARIVVERSDFVRERGMGAVGPLMGVAMQNLRGKADGKLISRILTEKIREELA